MMTNDQLDEKLISQLFDTQPDSVVWFMPVINGNETITDFQVKYFNAAALKIIGTNSDSVLNASLLKSAVMDEQSKNLIFQQCLQVWNTNEPIEFNYYNPGFNKHFNVQRSKVMNGVLSLTRDRTSEVKAEEEQKKQSLLFNKVLDNSPIYIILCQAIRDTSNKIYDAKLLMINDKVARELQLPKDKIQHTTFCTLLPDAKTNGFCEIMSGVLESGACYRNEFYFPGLGGWLFVSADKVEEDKLITTYLNINASKNNTLQLEQQSRWYNNVLRHSSNGIMCLESIRDEKNKIVDFEVKLSNPSGIKMGNLPEDAVGRKICELIPQFKESGYFEFHKEVVETGKPYKNILPFENGITTQWFQVSLAKLGDGGLVSNFMDVTELKHQEKTIGDQSKMLNLILNSSLNGLYTLLAIRNEAHEIIDFEIGHVNDVFCKMSSRTREDLIGKSFLKTFPHAKPSGVFKRNCEILKSGINFREEIQYKGDGIDSWFDSSVSKVSDDKLVIAFNDISALKSAADKLQEANLGLIKSNERLSEFTHIASHDLNEPLRKIVTFINMLEERYGSNLEAGAKDYLTKINKTAGRMQTLIKDLLTYSQISNRFQEFRNVPLNKILHEVVTDLESSISKNGTIVSISDLPTVKGDHTQLRQIFQNLISNAVKFQNKKDTPKISVKSKGVISKNIDGHSKNFLLIEIEDNGIGFDQSQSEKIFQLFQRLHSRTDYEGTGIGLAIVCKAMENHNGFVEAESVVEKGSIFKLYFPNV